MIGKSNLAVNKKPRIKAATSTQGQNAEKGNDKDSTSKGLLKSRTHYQRGLAIYYQGRISIGTDGRFLVDGFRIDPDRVSCECPEFRKDAIPCPHFYAASLFQKKGKPKTVTQKVAERNGHGKPSTSLSACTACNGLCPYGQLPAICITNIIPIIRIGSFQLRVFKSTKQ
jgi:SWIM zinc finger